MQHKHHKDIAKSFSYEDYQQMLASQGNKCAICNEPETTTRKGTPKSLAIDHCHRHKQVRGLLCERCNKRLGHYEAAFDDSKMEHFIRYLGGRPDGTPTKFDGEVFEQQNPSHSPKGIDIEKHSKR
jgi:hypothetical protein